MEPTSAEKQEQPKSIWDNDKERLADDLLLRTSTQMAAAAGTGATILVWQEKISEVGYFAIGLLLFCVLATVFTHLANAIAYHRVAQHEVKYGTEALHTFTTKWHRAVWGICLIQLVLLLTGMWVVFDRLVLT